MVIRSISLYSFTLLWILSGISIAVDDSVAMAKLAASLHPAPFSWSTNSSSYCQWQYVSCDIHGRVASLALEEMIVSGYLPPEIGSLSHLRILSIMNTGVSGVIPRLDNLTSLETLYLGSNSFTRFAQGFLQGLPISLQEIIIGDNPLSSWTIPVELARLTNLSTFDAQNTSLMGRIPDIFESSSLIYLVLSFNNLSGYLPDSFAKSNIQFLYLQDQQEGLSGTIQVLSSMSSLVQVQLDDNHFTGHIPDLSNLQRLERLSLDNNLLTGIVPRSLASLYRVSFSNNKLQGPFPRFLLDKPMSGLKGNNFCTRSGEPCDTQVAELLDIVRGFGYPLLLSESWRGNDACNNWSFVTCNSKKEVSEVDFGHQNFGGTISPAFVNLTALKFLFLNDNNLTGSIPEQLTKFPHLEILDVSNNNLTGIIPKFDKSVKIATTGNHLLVKNPGTSKGMNRVRMVILLTVGTVCAGIGLFILGTRFSKYAGKRNIRVLDQGEASLECYADSMAEENEIRAKLKELELFDFKTLVAATQNFDSTNKLGQGGFGPVYKGKLQNGQEIAVKRLSKASGQGLEEFMNEVVVISKLKHKNLVVLQGCCITKQERMLVYEYMPYKSLDFFLFDSQKQKLLDWRKRFSIIEGTCCGLLYLHRDSRPRIIHRDLKASNILLDKDFNPKISDFGIARFLNSTGDLANTRRVVGTYGYMPPEYVKKGQFSEKSDVFGFGVLILEIVSGRPSAGVDNGEQSSSILEHAWRLWNANSLSTFIDPAISSPCYHEEIIRCIHVGLLCVQEVATDRPVVSAIISMLRSESDSLPAPTRPAFVEATSTDSFQTNNLSTTITVQR